MEQETTFRRVLWASAVFNLGGGVLFALRAAGFTPAVFSALIAPWKIAGVNPAARENCAT